MWMWSRVTEIARELEAEMIVVGDPIDMNGDPGTMSIRVHKFGEMLGEVSRTAR